ncbi:MAG: FAD-dependent monooxygenase [Pseudomonadota bacterium]
MVAHSTTDVDVAVVGGGPTGGLAALAAAQAGWRTALIAPDAGHDPRTSALLMPAINGLAAFGIWEGLEEACQPLATMRLIDATGRVPRAPEVTFDAHEIGLDQFGFNVPNDALNAALASAREGSITFINAPADTVLANTAPTVTAGDHTVTAKLLVAADGAHSLVREEAGLGVRRWQYDQAAFVTTLSHERPHGDTSTEFHTPAGPFTLVPLPGERSSLVWVGRPDDIARISKLDPGPLARAIEAQAHNILGRMAVDGPRGVIPMEGLIAKTLGKGHVVLVGEAGHRFPPIGAQGLNLGLRDVDVLHKLLGTAREKGHLDGVADAYGRTRKLDVVARTVGVDLLNRSLLSAAMPVSALRVLGVAAARNIPTVRRAMMQFGLGR